MNDIVIKQKTLKLIPRLLLFALLTAIFLFAALLALYGPIFIEGVKIAVSDKNPTVTVYLVIFVFGVLFFGFFMIYLFYRLIKPRDILIIGGNGFTDNSTMQSIGFIPWKYVKDIYIHQMYYSGFKSGKFLAVRTTGFKDADIPETKNIFKRVNKYRKDFVTYISLDITDTKYEDVLILMQEALRKYRARSYTIESWRDEDPDDEDNFGEAQSATIEKPSNFFSFFKPAKGYFITPVLISTNILIFIIMIISGVDLVVPDSQSLLDWGANFRPSTLAGEWWRLFTSIFLHIGIAHLLFNMYALLYIGLLLEPYLGKTRFLAAYLISGVAASAASLWWNDFSVAAGASGAIFGMYGVFLALLTTNIIDRTIRGSLLVSIAIFIAYNIFNGLTPESGIDNAAHVGGLISGFIIGYAFVPSLKKNHSLKLKFLTIGILLIVLLASSFSVYKTLPNDFGKFEEKITEFTALESKALKFFSLPYDTPAEKKLYELKNNGIRYWNESLKLIRSMRALNLPQTLKDRIDKLQEYCYLRIKSYELYYKAISEDTDKYQIEIYNCEKQIEAIIKEIVGEGTE